jgi:hypothetical protein
MQKRNQNAEPVSGILDKAPKIVDCFGGAGGFFVMLWALWVARPRGRWVFAVSGISIASFLGGKSAGWV